MTSSEIITMMQKLIDDGYYEIVAIRSQEVPFTPGEISHKSKIWENGEETEIELNGLCATTVKGVYMHSCDCTNTHCYSGKHKAIIAGYEYEYGEDEHEVIIHDPICIHIFD